MTARDSSTTERLRRALDALAQGRADSALFTPETWAALSPALKETSAFYRSLGPVRSFRLIEQESEGKDQVYRCRARYKSTPWVHRILLTGDGKIAGWAVGPI
jgi:hypothetical protein